MGSTLKQTVSISVDLQRILKNFRNTVLQGTAEVAAEQELVLLANTDLVTAHITGINSLVEDVAATVTRLNIAIVSLKAWYRHGPFLTKQQDKLLPAVMSISERQDAIEKVSHSLTLSNVIVPC